MAIISVSVQCCCPSSAIRNPQSIGKHHDDGETKDQGETASPPFWRYRVDLVDQFE